MREFLEKSKVRKLLDDGWAKGIYPRNDIMLLHEFTEQEIVKPYLDKIRTEIEQEYNRLSATRADEALELGECLGLKMSLKIIDKYKAENERK